MVDFEDACKGIDGLVNDYRLVSNHPALREHITERMFIYVNSLVGEAGLHKQKLVQDYVRRTKLIDSLREYEVRK